MPPYMKNKMRPQYNFYQKNIGSAFYKKVATLVKNDIPPPPWLQ